MRSYLLSSVRGGVILSIAAMFLAMTGAQAGQFVSDDAVQTNVVAETTHLVCRSEHNNSNIIRLVLHEVGSVYYTRTFDGSTWHFPRGEVSWYETQIETERQTYRSTDGKDWQARLTLDRVNGKLTMDFYKFSDYHSKFRHVREYTHTCSRSEVRRKF